MTDALLESETATDTTSNATSGGPSSQGGISGGTPPAAAKKETARRDYIVLEQTDDGTLVIVGTFNATSDRNAVKDAMAKLDTESGSFVAVTKGGWHVHTRTVETVKEARWS